MHLKKRLIQTAAVLGAASWMYATAAFQSEAVIPASAENQPSTFTEQMEETTEPALAALSEALTETETETLSETETETLSATEALSETETKTLPETETETLSETETETLPETETETLPETETEALSETETETLPETENLSSNAPVPGGYLSSSSYLLSPSFSELRSDLTDIISEYEGTWSVYVKDLKTKLSLTINSQPQDSASLIKLYIAGAVLEAVQKGDLSMTETIEQLLTDMIVVSDNEAANELVRYLGENHDHQDGLTVVNAFIVDHDYMDTHQYNGLEDPSLWYADSSNETSVADCGRLLEEIYNGDFVNHLASRRMEGYLLDQDITWKIPAGIPSEVVTANKTGEKDNTQNDAAIIYTPYRDYILCVMGTDLTDEDVAVEHIRSISAAVYDFFSQADSLVEYSQETEEE